MRVLVSSTGGYGHVLPLLPLAAALQQAGHDVLLATAAEACDVVRSLGFAAAVAGPTEAEMARLLEQFRRTTAGMAPEDVPTRGFPLLFGSARAGPMLRELLPVAEEWQPDLLVHEQAELAGPLVARLVGVPHVVHSFGGAVPASYVAAASAELADLWAEHGLPAPAYAGCYENLYLDLCPPSLQTVPIDHVNAVQRARPESPPAVGALDLEAVLPDDDGRPLVYVTLGTVFNPSSVIARVLAALGSLDVRVLVTLGPDGDPAALGPQPAHVRVARWVPQAQVLPHCATVVSHGGSGTILATAALGLPQVVLPQAADQFRNAAGLTRARAGIALPPDIASAAAISEAVRTVLSDGAAREGAAVVRDEIATMPAPDEVARRLESLVSRARAPRSGPA